MAETENQINNLQNSGPVKAAASFLWDLIKILIVALIIIVPFRMFVAEPFVVSGSSMKPNFHDRDYLIVDRISYRTSTPKRGDVIVMKYPKNESEFFIKRIIGLPGDTVKFDQGHVVIINKDYPQGLVLQEPYIPAGVETLGQSQDRTLGSGMYFVLGDNRPASSDSRIWGILPENDIVGKVWLRVFPVNQFGAIHAPIYQ